MKIKSNLYLIKICIISPLACSIIQKKVLLPSFYQLLIILLNFPLIYKNYISSLKRKLKLKLHEQQIKGILQCFNSKVSIITGGPGTGKTTLITCLLDILEQQGKSFKLAAPTGRAAKRMMEGTRKFATTIHRLLEFDVSTMSFTYNDSNALKTDFLIIDEASMIDVFLAHAILKAVSLDTHLIFYWRC